MSAVSNYADYIREKSHAYDDWPDENLVEAYRQKYYATMPRGNFYTQLEEEHTSPGEAIGKAARKVNELIVKPAIEGAKAVVHEPVAAIGTDIAMLKHGARSKAAQRARAKETILTKKAAAFEVMSAMPGGTQARLATRVAVNAGLGGVGGVAAATLEGGKPGDIARGGLLGTAIGSVAGVGGHLLSQKGARAVEPGQPSVGATAPPTQALVLSRPSAPTYVVRPPPRQLGPGQRQIGRGAEPVALIPERAVGGPRAMGRSHRPTNVPQAGAVMRMPSGASAVVQSVDRDGLVRLDVEGGGTATLPLDRVRRIGKGRSTARSVGGSTLHSFPSGLGEMIPESVKQAGRMLVSEEGARLPGTRSVSSRLRRLGPIGKELDRNLDQVEQFAGQQAGRLTNLWRRAGGTKLSPEEDLQLALAREGHVPPETTTPRVKEALAALHLADQETGQAALHVGEVDALRAQHLPHRVLHVDRLLSKRGQLTKEGRWAVAYDVARSNGKISEQESLRNLHSYVALRRLPEARVARALHDGSVDLSMAERLLREGTLGEGATLREAIDALRGTGKWAKSDPMSFRTTAREEATAFHRRALDLPWIERPSRAVPHTVEESWRAIMDNVVFGKDRERYQGLLRHLEPRAAKKAEEAVLHSRQPAAGPYGRTPTSSRAQEITSAILLGPDTAIKKLTAGINVLLTSDHTSFARGVKASMTRKGWDYARDLGVVREGVSEYLGGVGATFTKASNKYHRYVTGISLAVDRDRVVAANAGREWIGRLTDRLLKNPQHQTARLELSKYLLDPDQIVARGGLTEAEERMAVRQYVHLTEHLLVPKDLPPWMLSSPLGRVTSQFLHWKAAQGRLLARETVNQARAGNKRRLARNLAVMGGEMLPIGVAGSELIQLAKGKKGPKIFLRAVKRLQKGTATTRDKQIIVAHVAKGALLSPGLGLGEFGVPAVEAALGARGTEGRAVSMDEASEALAPSAAFVGLAADVGPRLAHAVANKRARKHLGPYLESRVGLARSTLPTVRRLSDMLQKREE